MFDYDPMAFIIVFCMGFWSLYNFYDGKTKDRNFFHFIFSFYFFKKICKQIYAHKYKGNNFKIVLSVFYIALFGFAWILMYYGIIGLLYKIFFGYR